MQLSICTLKVLPTNMYILKIYTLLCWKLIGFEYFIFKKYDNKMNVH